MAEPVRPEDNVFDFPVHMAAPRPPGLADGGGGPHDPRMEARVAKLEGRMDSVIDQLSAIRERLAKMEGKIDQLPSTWVMLTAIVGSQVALLGFTFAILRFALPR